MSENQQEGGFFDSLLMVAGGISGAIYGYEEGEFLGLVIGMLIVGAI